MAEELSGIKVEPSWLWKQRFSCTVLLRVKHFRQDPHTLLNTSNSTRTPFDKNAPSVRSHVRMYASTYWLNQPPNPRPRYISRSVSWPLLPSRSQVAVMPRLGYTKSRTGCLRCRQRRVKVRACSTSIFSIQYPWSSRSHSMSSSNSQVIV